MGRWGRQEGENRMIRARMHMPAGLRGMALALALALATIGSPALAQEDADDAGLSQQQEAVVSQQGELDSSADEASSPEHAFEADNDELVDRTPDATGADAPADIADAAVLPDVGAPSEDSNVQVQALDVTQDPSEVEGYDLAADSEPADSQGEPVGYDASAAPENGVAVQSSDSVRVGDWSYYESSDDAGNTVYVIDHYYGSSSSVTLPATLGGKQMYGVNFFSGGLPDSVTAVTFPDSIREIGASAFYGTNVRTVSFGRNSQLTTIGEQAFSRTPLTEFTLPAHVKTLGHDAFLNSALTKLTLNTELEPMVYEGNVYSGNNLYKVTTHYNPCGGCEGVTFVVPSGCKNYRMENGTLLSQDGSVLYAQQSDLGGGTYVVPSGVKILGAYSMCNNDTFSNIALPQGLTTMEEYCLYGTSIQSLVMPDSVVHVQGSICKYCDDLQSVRISNSLEELGECAGWECFYGCGNLSSLTLGSKLRVIGNACFADTQLTSVFLPDSLQQINFGAFGDISSLTSVSGGAGLKYIYKQAFQNAGITSFPFGANLKFVSNTAFTGCNFTPSYPAYMTPQSDGYYVYDGTLAVRGDKSYSLAYQVLDLVNQERAKQGLSALTMDADLLDAAMQRAAETSVCFSHERPTGQQCFTASSKMTRENIASGSSTAAGVMDQWMNSAGHRANILSEDTKSIGIGCVKVSGRYFWVQCFGTSQAATSSRPSDVSNVVMGVPYMTSGLDDFGSTFSIYPVSDDGQNIVRAGDALQKGASQRYGLFTYPWEGNDRVVTKIDDSCITWSLSGSGASLNSRAATVTGTGVGTFTLTASVGEGTVKGTLTRKVEVATYAVTFGTYESGHFSQLSQAKVESGAKATRPADPSRSGYAFTGWYTTSDCTAKFDFNRASTAHTTVYAGWHRLATYTVTYDTQGGSDMAPAYVTEGSKVNLPTDPTRYCYAFTGWYTTSACTAKFDFSRAITGNVTVHAGWKPAAPTWFWDVDYSDWYGDWVTYAATNGLMTGLKDTAGVNYTGAFDPNGSLTRGMVATVLWRVAGSPAAGSAGFPDVASGVWYTDAVNWCASAGVVTGYTGGPNKGRFCPDSLVTREELATMVWRFAKSQGVDVANPSTAKFYKTTDWRSVSDFAVEPLKWTSAVSLMGGVDYHNGTFGLEPQGTASRAMAAKVFTVLHRDVLTGKVSAHDLDEGEEGVVDAAAVTAVEPEQQTETPAVTTGVTDDGLAYAVVPEGALSEAGTAFEPDATYDELGGRYVGPGVYVTGYTGEQAALTLPVQIEGVPVVSANLAWGDGTAHDADVLGVDEHGRTRLTQLVLQKGCALVQLDVAGNALAQLNLLSQAEEQGMPALRFLDASANLLEQLDVLGCPALERLDVSANRMADISQLAAWVGATGLTADVSGQIAERPADEPVSSEPDAPAADAPAADEPAAGEPAASEPADDAADAAPAESAAGEPTPAGDEVPSDEGVTA